MSGRIKAGFVDFVVFSLEIDRVRCVPERSFLVRNWCRPPYRLAGARVIDHANRTVGSNPTLSARKGIEKSKYFDFLPTPEPTARHKVTADQGAEKHDRHQNAETLV
jgi:hypothetical protein